METELANAVVSVGDLLPPESQASFSSNYNANSNHISSKLERLNMNLCSCPYTAGK